MTDEAVADMRQYRRFRNYAFFGMACFVTTLLVTLVSWVRSLGERIFNGALSADTTHAAAYLAPIVVIASLVAVAVLPMMRYVFRERADDSNDESDKLTLWQSVIHELSDLLKTWLAARKPAS